MKVSHVAYDLLEHTPLVVFGGMSGDVRAWVLMDGRESVFANVMDNGTDEVPL